jgi:hypothetical protein
MGEVTLCVAIRRGQRDPELDTVQRRTGID